MFSFNSDPSGQRALRPLPDVFLAAINSMGGSEFIRQIQQLLVEINANEDRRSHHAGAHNGCQADRPGAEVKTGIEVDRVDNPIGCARSRGRIDIVVDLN